VIRGGKKGRSLQTWLRNAKIVKWIIEAAALNDKTTTIQIATLIKNLSFLILKKVNTVPFL
jgi:hypothetical protein